VQYNDETTAVILIIEIDQEINPYNVCLMDLYH
jgi:hypothetical protein